MKKSALGIGGLLVLAATSASAQVTCASMTSTIDHALKIIASANYGEGMFDDSAPRKTNRQLEINNNLIVISTNVSLMQQAKCPAPPFPIDLGQAYMSNAIDCASAKMRPNASPETKELCQLSNWKRK